MIKSATFLAGEDEEIIHCFAGKIVQFSMSYIRAWCWLSLPAHSLLNGVTAIIYTGFEDNTHRSIEESEFQMQSSYESRTVYKQQMYHTDGLELYQIPKKEKWIMSIKWKLCVICWIIKSS